MAHPQRNLPSPFYRVAVKAIILNDQNQLLVGLKDSQWEMPGGGLEHNESIETCLKRELQEELGVDLESFADIAFTYRAQNPKGYWALRLATPVKLKTYNFKFGDLNEAKFVTRDELLALDMSPDEAVIKECVDKIWPDAS